MLSSSVLNLVKLRGFYITYLLHNEEYKANTAASKTLLKKIKAEDSLPNYH